MERKEQLKFCRVCENKSFDRDKGIICKLTGEIANFEVFCEKFAGEREQIILVDAKKEKKEKKYQTFFRSRILPFFIPVEGYFVTPILIHVFLLVFIVTLILGGSMIFPDGDVLIKVGASFTPKTIDGQYWRLLTSIFVHIGFIHLLANSVVLYYIGSILEPFIGRRYFIISFISTGIIASIVSLWWHDLTVAAGASGAIFGLFGVNIALITTNLYTKEQRNPALVSMLVFVGYNLVYGLRGGVDNAAHLGGLLSGLIVGYSLYPSLTKRQPHKRTRNTLLYYGTISMALFLTFIITLNKPKPSVEYFKYMDSFAKLEEKALGLYRLSSFAPREMQLNAISRDGIPNWKECKTVLCKIDSIKGLPEDLLERNLLVKEYCDLRIVSYKLILNSIKQGNPLYSFLIEGYNRRIEQLLNELTAKSHNTTTIDGTELAEFSSQIKEEILYVVEGVPVSNIDTFDIDKVHPECFLPPEKSESIYGAMGKNGALFIELLE